MEPNTPAVRLTKVLIDFSAFGASPTTGANKPRYIIKELTVVDIDTGCHQHWIFKPPKGATFWTKHYLVDLHNQWLCERYHGLDFYLGLTEYESLDAALDYHCKGANLLFAPNRAKANILEDLFNTKRVVFDLQALGCPPCPSYRFCSRSIESFDGVTVSTYYRTDDMPRKDDHNAETNKELLTLLPCLYHKICGGFVCTQPRALHVAEWCRLNPSALDMNDPANREKTFGGWELSVPSAQDVANAGFVRIGTTEDSTKCVYCSFTHGQWKYGNDPNKEHEDNAPGCKLLAYRYQMRRNEEKEKVDCLAKSCDTSTQTVDMDCAPWKNRIGVQLYRQCGRNRDITLRDLYSKCRA